MLVIIFVVPQSSESSRPTAGFQGWRNIKAQKVTPVPTRNSRMVSHTRIKVSIHYTIRNTLRHPSLSPAALPNHHTRLRLQTNTPISTILLKDPAKADPLPNPRLLEPILGNIPDPPDRLLQHTKMELPPTTDIILQHIGNGRQSVVATREEDLCRPAIVSTLKIVRDGGRGHTIYQNPTSTQSYETPPPQTWC